MSMKKMISTCVLILLLISSVGCSLFSSFDAKEYLNQEMKSTYLDEHTDTFIKLLGDVYTKEELQQMYESGVQLETEYFIGSYLGFDLSLMDDDTKMRSIDLYDQIYAHTKYEIIEVKQVNQNYEVSMLVYPIDIIQTSITDTYYQELESSESDLITMDDATFANFATQLALDKIEQNIENISYLEVVEILVHIEYIDGTYVLNNEDWAQIDTHVIAYE